MATYSTPGVYVEEITKFPPSVAQVETAIPAFIGYTEKATKKVNGDLIGKPIRISSLLEYEEFFGKAKQETDITVTVTDGDVNATPPEKPNKSPFLMYYSMQMYFANGGGPCYISSVGEYGAAAGDQKTAVVLADLQSGLAEIRKEDEPTLLLFPDATSLAGDGDFYAIYTEALQQCKDLQDRFTIIDTYSDKEHDTSLSDPGGTPYVTLDPDDAIRSGITLGKDYLKYGAVYYPFLETILDYAYDESQIDVTIASSSPTNVQQEVQNISDTINTALIDVMIAELDTLEADVTALSGPSEDADAVAMIPDIKANVNKMLSYIHGLQAELEKALSVARNDGSAPTQANALDTWITDVLEETVLGLNKTIDRLNADTSKTMVLNEITSSTTSVNALRRVLGIHDDDTPATDPLKVKIDTLVASGELKDLIDNLPTASGSAVVKKLSVIKDEDDQMYNAIKAEIGLMPVKLPPSSTMAGVYARVDSDRGVWKAPANVGVVYVSKPSVPVSSEDQELLNVHPPTGKSINAIRTFIGKGTLVWGARTLAGNDNEWRYVPVRRFFNMAEESIKKATEQFVFEPNDKNTWTRVKAMIDNFLTQQWRAGALAGPTPDKAFYVNVGLGETMTAQNILEGEMIVEIGMAVVRPAEFIILRFSHKMQEA
ncbi:phage tail sheath family protein [Sungkyunkwania multivorans]|uniref:Phage tail sheath family protein n=1 Tax=Sungkyunkwania multivorans TaxID=1173618 RepID=A0ABW3CXV7_9FLAO